MLFGNASWVLSFGSNKQPYIGPPQDHTLGLREENFVVCSFDFSMYDYRK